MYKVHANSKILFMKNYKQEMAIYSRETPLKQKETNSERGRAKRLKKTASFTDLKESWSN